MNFEELSTVFGAGQDLVRDPFGGNTHSQEWPLTIILQNGRFQVCA